MRTLALVVLAACSSPRLLVDEVVKQNPIGGMGTARTQIAVARAEIAAKQSAAARPRIDAALVRLRTGEVMDVALLEAVDALVALGDEAGATQLRGEAVAKIGLSEHRNVVIRDAFEAQVDLESKLANDALAELVVRGDPSPLDAIVVDSRVWRSVIEQLPDATHALLLARRARLAGKLDIAKQLAERAATTPPTRPEDRLEIAEALALAGAGDAARPLIAKLDGFTEPAVGLAQLARVHALLGDAAASQDAAKRAAAAGAGVGVEYLILASMKRGDVDGAIMVANERMTKYLAADLAAWMIDQGQHADVDKLVESLTGESLSFATTQIVMIEIERGELDAAGKRANEPFTKELVARAHARAGNVALGKDHPELLAHWLARRGKCGEAIATIKRAKYPGETLAQIARYCPTSKL